MADARGFGVPAGRISMPTKVLLIDDDPDFRAAVRSLLESHGYQLRDLGIDCIATFRTFD